jgi:hypothetical protein
MRAQTWWKIRFKAFKERFPKYRRPPRGQTKWVRATSVEREKQELTHRPILRDELDLAERTIIREMQQKYVPEAWKQLAGKSEAIFEGLVWNEDLNLLMSRSRQNQANEDVAPCQRDLIFIPYDTGEIHTPRKINKGLELLMTECHMKTGHGSASTTMAEFRTRFWCKNARKMAIWVKKKCHTCRTLDAQPFSVPTAPLPKFRYLGKDAFSAVGVDFVGPFSSDWTEEKFSILALSPGQFSSNLSWVLEQRSSSLYSTPSSMNTGSNPGLWSQTELPPSETPGHQPCSKRETYSRNPSKTEESSGISMPQGLLGGEDSTRGS